MDGFTPVNSTAGFSEYCESLTRYQRRKTIPVNIGNIGCGGDNPVRIQSMTTAETMDTEGTVNEAIRLIEAGSEYVRITVPSKKEAENLKNIRNELHKRGYYTPLIADVHFTPNAAETAARIVEKVRINPGNFADKKKFQELAFTDESYQKEIDRIRNKFLPLVHICKENGTAMRIGTNHGSLSDRIMSRYGDTPLGMVESALEFIRICEEESFYNIVISMKASNTQVMVQAYRLLVHQLNEEGLQPYPLHLGVTEAGEAEDGRIKSAIGIGTLLEDGLGDTIRVSLTEPPEKELPVARVLADRYKHRNIHDPIPPVDHNPVNPYAHTRRKSNTVLNIGGDHVPRVIADFSHIQNLSYKDLEAAGHFYLPATDKWGMNDYGCDYIYSGDHETPFMLPNGVREILDYNTWQVCTDTKNKYPLFKASEYLHATSKHADLNFVYLQLHDLDLSLKTALKKENTAVLLIDTDNEHAMPELRRIFFELINEDIQCPVIIKRKYPLIGNDKFQLYAATDIGALLIDGLGDGDMIGTEQAVQDNKQDQLQLLKAYNDTAFGVLQGARMRMSKTEYISCPSCGRTQFDLQETTAMIRKRTDHLKGVKIGIMGCIVNGPGEMADADYGYVGTGRGKIALYRGKEIVKKDVPSEQALDELIELIKEDGNWREPEC